MCSTFINGPKFSIRCISQTTPLKMSLQHTRLAVRNPRGYNLAALLTTTASPPQPLNLELTILCHGFQDSKHGHLVTYLSETLPFPTVRIDFSGNGESEGPFRYANYLDEVADLRALILHLRGLGAKIKTIVGHSKGGGVVLLYAAQYGDIPNVINLAARFDMRRGVKERFGEQRYEQLLKGESIAMSGQRNGKRFQYTIEKEDLLERFDIDMCKAAKAISSHVQVLTLHGNGDEIIPVKDAHEIDRRLSNGRLVIMDDCGHSFRGFEDKVVDEILGFLLI